MKKKALGLVCVLVVLIVFFMPAVMDCGDSDLYTIEERKAAAALVADMVNSFDGCKLYAVEYEGDDVSKKNLEYCDSLASAGVSYSDCIVFTSCFRSPFFGGGAWNANEIYSWHWYLARTEDDGWEILTYGYP